MASGAAPQAAPEGARNAAPQRAPDRGPQRSQEWLGRPRDGGPGWVLWVALAATWFATLQLRPLLDPDEGRYAEIPREMLATGDWVTPRLDGLKYFEKPPLQYWTTAAAYSAFGLSEWTARLWTVGLAFLCLPMVFAWGCRLYGVRAGLVALAALATSPYFVLVGHLNLLDPGFTLWLTAAVFAFTIAQNAPTGSPGQRRWMIATWIAAALAVLSKGIVVGVLALLTLILYSLLERDWRPWRRLHLALGVPLFLLITAPWFVAVSRRNPEFPQFFFIHEHFARFLTTVHQRAEPWWYFLPLVLFGVLPWVRFVPGLARRAWFDPGLSVQFRPQKFLLIFAAVTLVFFSLSGSKLAPYVLPMMPVLAALAGVHCASRPQLLRHAGWFTASVLMGMAVALCVFSVLHAGTLTRETVVWTSGAAFAGLLTTAGVMSWPAAVQARPVVILGALSVLGWQCLLSAYTATPPLRTAKELVSVASEAIRPETALYSVGQYRHSVSVYLRRTMILVGYTGELEFGVQREPGKQSATPEEFLARWRASSDAVAFFAPPVYDGYRMKGLPGRVIAADSTTVVVSRSEFPQAAGSPES